MTTEDELRRALRDGTGSRPQTVDAERIVVEARRRRRPRVAIASGVGALAVVGVVTLGIPLVAGTGPTVTTFGAADTAPGGAAPSDGNILAPEALSSDAARSSAAVATCGAVLPAVAADPSAPLAIEVSLPATVAPGASADGVVRVTNRSGDAFTGTAAPAASLAVTAADGTVVWHSNGPVILAYTPLDLPPGATLELPTTVTAVRCDPQDEALPAFRENLPPLDPGTYAVTAALEVTAESGPAWSLSSAAEPLGVR